MRYHKIEVGHWDNGYYCNVFETVDNVTTVYDTFGRRWLFRLRRAFMQRRLVFLGYTPDMAWLHAIDDMKRRGE